MANRNNHALINATSTWTLSDFPEYIRNPSIIEIQTDPGNENPWNGDKIAMLNGSITKAILEYAKGKKSSIALVQVGVGSYASEMELKDGTVLIASASDNGALNACIAKKNNLYEAVPASFAQLRSSFDTSSILILYLMLASEMGSDVVKNDLSAVRIAADEGKDIPLSSIIRLNNVIQTGLNQGFIKSQSQLLQNGISMLYKRQVENGSLNGNLLCGRPKLIIKPEEEREFPRTVGEAKERVKEYTKSLVWSEEEIKLIPVYPDDFKVPEEVWDMIDDFVSTRGDRISFNNFGWRGKSGYGKSFGISIMACILNTPHYVINCNINTETEDFLSRYVPVPEKTSDEALSEMEKLPSAADMCYDPEGAYWSLTGEIRESVSDEELRASYFKRALEIAAGFQSGAPAFKLVESVFVKALRTGAIVEIAEYNVIRDTGVLKGLNAYDEPGAMIPLANGTFVKRHPNAITVWTGNIGYSSSREDEWSVSRRIRTFIDTFEVSEELTIDRIIYNTEGRLPYDTIKGFFQVWKKISDYCKEQQIHTDLSPVSLENWCAEMTRHGMNEKEKFCKRCIISQCSSDQETQETIYTVVAKPEIAKLRF